MVLFGAIGTSGGFEFELDCEFSDELGVSSKIYVHGSLNHTEYTAQLSRVISLSPQSVIKYRGYGLEGICTRKV